MPMELLPLVEMAKRLGISTRTLRRKIITLNIPHYRTGKQMCFDPSEVVAYFRVTDAAPSSKNVITFPTRRKRRPAELSKFAKAIGL